MVARILCIVSLVFCLVGCAAQRTVVGSWRGVANVDDSVMGMKVPPFVKSFLDGTVLTIKADGTYDSTNFEGTWKFDGKKMSMKNKRFLKFSLEDAKKAQEQFPIPFDMDEIANMEFTLSPDGNTLTQVKNGSFNPVGFTFKRI